ncbi:hypothetical protein DQ04_02271030 [Trypanosoma grayi]|uniref:hypothetical protein n=1 Tax=Trypanosoma grayi TaxID=71804 RepID=UPI0004F4215F|nr:hypothetical protein DQ04_02271030 [Trypanosoma grayi]KEG11793.1 hypothetical protein DQ04_02271030 [Trypanosoma grayi]
MLLRTLCRWSKRTPGYVFWRQGTLVELEHAKRNYLLSERPVPIADIARRMVRVKARYTDTRDFHEQNLLRGEYKYFSGKLCDIRHARPEDMIAYVECGSFFGFWDTAQMDRVMQELLLKLDELAPVELVHLFTALPSLRKQSSTLFQHVARALVAAVPELSVEECIRVSAVCDDATPQELLHNVMRAIEPEAARGGLTAAQAVELMDTLGACAPGVQRQFVSLLDAMKRTAVAGMAELSVLDIAALCAALRIRDALDPVTEGGAVRLFLARLDETCARSTAMMFTAVHSIIAFAQAMEERVVFLATDFTPSELLSVFAAYMDDYTSMCLVSTEDRVAAASGEEVGVVGATAAAPEATMNLVLRQRVEELQFAQQRQSALVHVLRELMGQMVALLESASAYVSPAVQLQHLAVFHKAVEDLGGNVILLTEAFPRTARCVDLLSAKIIASLPQYTYGELAALLQLCGPLGKLVADAAVGAAVQELIRRDVGVSRGEAMELCAVLQALSGLRGEHQARIERSLVPKLRERSAQAA